MNRTNTLLMEAAKALQDGTDPFNTNWLVEHDVTLDECYWLSDRMGAIIAGFLVSPRATQHVVLINGAAKATGTDISPEVVQRTVMYREAMGRLK